MLCCRQCTVFVFKTPATFGKRACLSLFNRLQAPSSATSALQSANATVLAGNVSCTVNVDWVGDESENATVVAFDVVLQVGWTLVAGAVVSVVMCLIGRADIVVIVNVITAVIVVSIIEIAIITFIIIYTCSTITFSHTIITIIITSSRIITCRAATRCIARPASRCLRCRRVLAAAAAAAAASRSH